MLCMEICFPFLSFFSSASQFVIRPSELVTAVNARLVLWGEDWQIRVAMMRAAGRPVVVSRTWHVMGSLVVILEVVEGFDR